MKRFPIKDWETIENQAAKAKDKDATTFKKLVDFLDEPIKDHIDRDAYMTRGLLYWLNCNSHQTDVSGKSSPLNLAAKMFTGKIAYADAFTTLCQNADITCETVEGVSKTGDYKPGDLEVDKDKMKAYWNKVFLLGQWWPIHPRWALRSVKETKALNQDDASAKFRFNDFWFLTPPEIFITKCYPDDPENQLLPFSLRVKRPRQFMKLPYMTPLFYEYGLKLTSEESCIVNTTDGKTIVSMKVDKLKSKLLECRYTFHSDEKDRVDHGNCVFSSRKRDHFLFEVRCPVATSYSLVILGALPAESSKVLCKTKIVCREPMPDFRPLPTVADFRWGFSPRASSSGLSKQTAKAPKIFINPPAKNKKASTVLKFKIESCLDAVNTFKAELHTASKTSDQFKDCVKTNQDKRKHELCIEATVPESGEYALVISVLNKDDKDQKYSPICNYLLTTLESEEKVNEEYYDSSDGTSDIDEEIEKLQQSLRNITSARDKRREQGTKEKTLSKYTSDTASRLLHLI